MCDPEFRRKVELWKEAHLIRRDFKTICQAIHDDRDRTRRGRKVKVDCLLLLNDAGLCSSRNHREASIGTESESLQLFALLSAKTTRASGTRLDLTPSDGSNSMGGLCGVAFSCRCSSGLG